MPLEDFGGGHPDPNLTYAHDLVELQWSDKAGTPLLANMMLLAVTSMQASDRPLQSFARHLEECVLQAWCVPESTDSRSHRRG